MRYSNTRFAIHNVREKNMNLNLNILVVHQSMLCLTVNSYVHVCLTVLWETRAYSTKLLAKHSVCRTGVIYVDSY